MTPLFRLLTAALLIITASFGYYYLTATVPSSSPVVVERAAPPLTPSSVAPVAAPIVAPPAVVAPAAPDLDEIFDYKIRAPELTGLQNWLNSEPIESLAELRGKVVMVKFWTLGCINCIHTLPYVNAWHDDFADDGLVILGIHTPEFQYERDANTLAAKLREFEIEFPVAQDNDSKTWRAYKNHYWPAQYLIDKQGFIRYFHYGEGKYDETRAAIETLLAAP